MNNLSKKGIYRIINNTNNKIYVGSTIKTFKSRFKTHISKLRNNKHEKSSNRRLLLFYLGLIPNVIRPTRLMRVIFHTGDQTTSTLASSIPSICLRAETRSIGRVSAQEQPASVKVIVTVQRPCSSRLIS